VPPHPTHQVRILHDGHRTVASNGLKEISPNEQALIPVGDPEPPHPRSHAALDQPGLPTWRVDLQPKAATNRPAARRATHVVEPPLTEPRVGMQEQQPLPHRARPPRVHLATATPMSIDPLNGGPCATDRLKRRVASIAACDDYLDVDGRVQHLEQSSERVGIAQHRDDDGDEGITHQEGPLRIG
jgi:hypothetical protein